uniref:Testis expressed 47 n=1 Tax=Naja naja TaxID=35670 RepID=A0A8C6XT81_NAJNA
KPIPKICQVYLFKCSRGGEFVALQLLPNHNVQKPEPLFQKISRSHLGEAASGILLIYSQSILHILEASSGTLYHILMDLALFEHQGAIMVMSHNIPTRLFSQWNATKLEVPVTLEDVTQSQTTEEVITECLTLILKMGVYLATLKVRMGNKDLGECLHTTMPELLIPAETIQYLCRSQECLSPEEFLKMYNKPLQPQMDSAFF